MNSPSEEFLRRAAEARTRITEVSAAEARTRVQAGAVLLDVRTADEFAGSHLPGATHLGDGRLEDEIRRAVPDRAAAIVCYCAGGNRSALAADALQKLGYVNVVSIRGGLSAGRAAGEMG